MVSGGQADAPAVRGERDALSLWMRRQLRDWWRSWRWLIFVLLLPTLYGIAYNVLYVLAAGEVAGGGRGGLYEAYRFWRSRTWPVESAQPFLDYAMAFCLILLFADLAIRFASLPAELAVALQRRSTYHRLRGAARIAGYVLVLLIRLLPWSIFGNAVAAVLYGASMGMGMTFRGVGLNLLVWVLIVELAVWLVVARRVRQLWHVTVILVLTLAAWILLHMGASWYFLTYCFTSGTRASSWPNLVVTYATAVLAIGFYLAGRFRRASAPES